MSSMKDVAEIAGVSVSTVSRVINKTIPVDKKTRLKVLGAIDKLNYRPNLLAKGLRVKSGHLIGFAVPEISHHPFIKLINHIEECVDKHGFNLIIGNTHNDPEIEIEFIDRLIRRNIDGIIFSRVSDESRAIGMLKESNIPVVALDRELDDRDVFSVTLDNYKAGVIAAEHLIKLGHKKIACITGPLNIKLCRERLRGFRDCLKENKLKHNGHYLFEGNFKFQSGIEGVNIFLKNKIEFTAVWAQNDLMAIGALKAFMTNKARVPSDFSLMGMDDLGIARMVTPALTTISQPFKEMSEKAVELIMSLGKNEMPVERKIVLEPSILVRESTAHVH